MIAKGKCHNDNLINNKEGDKKVIVADSICKVKFCHYVVALELYE